MNRWSRIGAALASAATLAAFSSGAAAAHPAARATTDCHLPLFGAGVAYHPQIDPTQFTAHVDNSFFPLRPGQTLVYSGTKDGKKALDLFHPSRRTALIDGVRTRVVEDELFLDGVLEERTTDYYAQDRCGNVWYFGEDTATLDRGGQVTSTEGSFHAGVDGAQPGVFMQARPQLGRRFRQEWYRGQAEDQFHAVDLSTSITVPHGHFRHALRTAEQTALEPGVLDNKWYVAGVGEVEELAVKGPLERLVLIDVLF